MTNSAPANIPKYKIAFLVISAFFNALSTPLKIYLRDLTINIFLNKVLSFRLIAALRKNDSMKK